MRFRFAGFELDPGRAELRKPGGEAVNLRPKTFAILALFAANPGRVLSKQELMEAVWRNVHVGDDSLFQCISEIRAALDDDDRAIVKLVSGRGYLFEADVCQEPATPALASAGLQPELDRSSERAATAAAPPFRRRTVLALAAAAAGVALVGMAIGATMVGSGRLAGRGPVTVAVMPITSADGNLAAIAADVTTRLSDGLAKIENVRVAAPQNAGQESGTTSGTASGIESGAARPDFVVSGELGKHGESWEVRARMIRTATGDIVWTTPVSLAADDGNSTLQQSRLAASIGEPLARRINALVNSDAKPNDNPTSSGSAGVAIEQAKESIAQVTQERFAASGAMLEKALADDPDNVDLAVALAALQLRGVQMVWYTPTESAAAETHARAILERGLKRKPDYLPVLEAYCRFLNATNEFVDSLVACARVLSFDPWNGIALYHIGLGQLQLGRFDQALATFKRADSFDTPPTQRWTWKLGAGMTYLVMDDSENALPWLQRSIAITPATGRSYMLLSAALERSGHPEEARAAMEKGMTLRPGSNLANVQLPPKNANSTFLAASERVARAYLAAGLPER
jgi:DNA-binding winged helix-turn-helix (wHTH) protein/tetratricopeptide (TPR) repeat protein